MMSPDGQYTFNPLSNEDKELLLSHGYIPGELPPEDERSLLIDLREQSGDEDGIEPLSDIVIADEDDGAE